jgi:hypothetical protein
VTHYRHVTKVDEDEDGLATVDGSFPARRPRCPLRLSSVDAHLILDPGEHRRHAAEPERAD